MSSASSEPALVSVIVPAWNAAATIARAIGSVIEAGGPPVECLVVDDASVDGTSEAATTAAAGDARVRILRQAENRGVSAARNRGLDEARGEWLLFLDADDRLLPGALRALAEGAARGALAVVGQRISTDGERTWVPALYDLPDIREPGWKSVARNPGLLYYASPHGKLLHRSLAEDLRFAGRALGDQPWILRALLRAGDRILVIGDVVYEWHRPHPERYVPTITAARERSAALGAEAVAMAGTAYRLVVDEMARTVSPEERPALAAAYFDRLIRADLAAQLTAAVRRRDADLPLLLAALENFLAGIPASVVDGSDALLGRIVRPPLAHWWSLGPSTRAAFQSMLQPILRARGVEPPRVRDGRTGRPAGVPTERLLLPARVVLAAARRTGGSPRGVTIATLGLSIVYAPYRPLEAAFRAGRRALRAGARIVRIARVARGGATRRA